MQRGPYASEVVFDIGEGSRCPCLGTKEAPDENDCRGRHSSVRRRSRYALPMAVHGKGLTRKEILSATSRAWNSISMCRVRLLGSTYCRSSLGPEIHCMRECSNLCER